jgi:radical SAM protein with 4Fe4S-binding SPASM domain
MRVLFAPYELSWILTQKCNLNCRHCLIPESCGSPEISSEEIRAIIRQIIELKIFRVRISGGEPLVHRDLFTVLDALGKANVTLTLFTNGTLINRRVAKRLAACPVKYYNVSLDGSRAEIHDAIRGAGSFDKAVKGIKNVIAQGGDVTTAVTLTRLNYHDAEKTVLLAKRLGAQRVQFVELMYLGNAVCNADDIAMTANERFELLTIVRGLKIKYGGFIVGSIAGQLESADSLRLSPKPRFPLKVSTCVAGMIRCAIRPDGWVAPCERLWFLKAGDLRKKSLQEIWRHSPLLQTFRKPFVINKKNMPACSKCRFLKPCFRVRRCKPYFLFRDKIECQGLSCGNGMGSC